MENTETFKKPLEDIIAKYKLYGRSFTYGVALKIAMQDQLLYEDLNRMVEEMVEDLYGETLDVMRKTGLRTDLYALSSVIDISVLDEIARHIIEEDEE